MPKTARAKKLVTLTLDTEDRKLAEKLERAWKTTFSEVVRRSIREAVNRQDTAIVSN